MFSRLFFTLLLALGLAAPCLAAPLELSNQPLQVGFEPPPNVMFVVDNSGSMDWNVVTEEGYNSVFEVRDDDNDLCYLVYTHPTYENDAYRDPGDDDTTGSDIIYDYDNYYPVPPNEGDPSKHFWRARNKDFNLLYYDPARTYTPWSGEDINDVVYANATPAAARVDPYDPSEGTFDLTTNTQYYSESGYGCQDGDMASDTSYYPSRYWRWTDTDGDGNVEGSDTHTLVEIKPGNAPFTGDGRESRSDCTAGSCSYDEEIQNFANWFQYYRRRMLTAQAAYTQAIDDNENPAFVGLTTLNGHSPVVNTPVTDITIEANRSYFLKQLAQMRGSGGTPLRSNAFSTGEYLACDDNDYSFSSPSHINNGSYCPRLPASQGGACQKNFMVIMTDGYYNGSFSFPTLLGLLGDTNHDEEDDATPWDGNEYADTEGNTLADIAMYFFENDIHDDDASYPDIVNHILVAGNNSVVPPLAPIVASHQHITTYGVAFGVEGTLGQDEASVAAREHATPKMPDIGASNNWPDPDDGDPQKIDDLVHAAFNGRGSFFSAREPELLKESLAQILAEATQPSGSASSAGSVRSSIIAGGFLYQSVGDPNDWSGSLLARPVSTGNPTTLNGGDNHILCVDLLGAVLPVGDPCPPVWDSGNVLNGQDWNSGREIFTSHNDLGTSPGTPATRQGIAFRWDNLSDEQKLRLRHNAVSGYTNSTYWGGKRLEYLRGRTDISAFRQRSSVLGDILDSGSVYVGGPGYNYTFGDYASFLQTYKNRNGVIYTGANDGMLHAFNATNGATGAALNGDELFGYIPGDRILWANLSRLTHKSYRSTNHRYFVNGQPTYVDAQVGGSPNGNGDLTGASWKSLLAGGLGNGGQLVYLLDITNPAGFDEDSDPASALLWEFSDMDDPDLGFTHSTPTIARMANGKWAVIIGNGYNNSDDDSNYGTTINSVSNNGQAHLFILYVDGPGADGVWNEGTDYFKIPVSGGSTGTPNGMATPIAIDINGDYRVEYIYAGDQLGQMWRFDVTSTTASNWDNVSNPPVKIFTALNSSGQAQPISTRPEVASHPQGVNHGVIVLFGTGRYMDVNIDGDEDNYPVQSFYGIWDTLADNYSPPTRDHTFSSGGETRKVLQQQTILEEVQYTGTDAADGSGNTEACDQTQNCFRIITDNSVNLTAGQNRGWYLDLVNTQQGANSNSFGERMITNPIVRGERIVFTTLLPRDSDNVCSSGGDGWVMELNIYGGGHPTAPVFDSNGDNQVDDSDKLNISVIDQVDAYVSPPGGIKFDFNKGLLPSPAIIVAPLSNIEKKCFPRENGTMECILEAGPADGRLSWRELK